MIAGDHRRLHRPARPRVPAAAALAAPAEGRRQDPRRGPERRLVASPASSASWPRSRSEPRARRRTRAPRRGARVARSCPVELVRIALLANPELGIGRGGGGRDRLRASRGPTSTCFALDAGDAAVASAPERIVVAGGDGSVALRGRGRGDAPASRSAVIPVGTANDFARALELPHRPRRGGELAVNGARTRGLDLGRDRRAAVRQRRQRRALADRGAQGARAQAPARSARLRDRRAARRADRRSRSRAGCAATAPRSSPARPGR